MPVSRDREQLPHLGHAARHARQADGRQRPSIFPAGLIREAGLSRYAATARILVGARGRGADPCWRSRPLRALLKEEPRTEAIADVSLKSPGRQDLLIMRPACFTCL